MARARGDRSTLDLLAWEPPRLVHRFEDKQVASSNLRARLARAVATTLKECGISREAVTFRMRDWLEDETLTKNMLDAYASEARSEHTISYLRLLALCHVTQDMRLLQLGAELFQRSVVEDRHLGWVEVGQLADKKDDLDRRLDAARRLARRGGQP